VDIDDVISFLAPFLPGLVLSSAAPTEPPGAAHARRLWEALEPAVTARPAAYRAARRLAAYPEDRRVRLAFRLQLGHLLNSDPVLADVLSRRWEAARAAGVVPHQPEPEPVPGPTGAGQPEVAEPDELTDSRRHLDRPLPDGEPRIDGEPAPPRRWLQVKVEEADPARPLPPSEISTLAFWVAPETAAPGAPFDERVFRAAAQSERDERLVRLQVVVFSDDFWVETPEAQSLIVPRQGRSRNWARFDIEPKRAGDGTVTATFYKEGNFVQGMVVHLRVGTGEGPAVTRVEPQGRPLEASAALRPRNLSLFIQQSQGAYQLIAHGALSGSCTLRFGPDTLARMLEDARAALEAVVYLSNGPGGLSFRPRGTKPSARVPLPYQRDVQIPPDVAAAALRRLADAGRTLYQQLFYRHNGQGARELGNRLRDRARAGTLKIQIVSRDLFLPWALLYLGGRDEVERPDPELFLGLRHMIEHIPLEQPPVPPPADISSEPRLNISFNLDTAEDRLVRVAENGGHVAYSRVLTEAAAQVTVATRTTSDEVRQALFDAANPDQIIYFYCHAAVRGPLSDGRPDHAYLQLSGGSRLVLEDLWPQWYEDSAPLPGAPLIFVNACGSLELSPLFYGGFLQFFARLGARGMLGTECDVPAVFAAAWARRFFDRFLSGRETLGEVVWSLRREFHRDHHNLLGLVYALYCDLDTRVTPGLRLP
jgi:hypothetical protein